MKVEWLLGRGDPNRRNWHYRCECWGTVLVLEEMEEKMLDVLQTRDWFTAKQLLYLEAIERVNAYQL